MIRRWLWLVLSLALAGPAFAEMPSDVNAVFAERQHQIDTRIENLERQQNLSIESLKTLLVEREKLRESDLRTVRVNIEDNVRFFGAQIANIRELIAAGATASKESVLAASVSQQEAFRAAVGAAKEAVDKAAVATEKRFDAVNEFRGQLKDQQQMLMPRAEAESKIQANMSSLSILTQRIDQISGRTQGTDAAWLTVTGAAGLLIGAAGVAITLMRRSPNDHDPMIERLAGETELSRIRSAISAESAALASRVQRLEGKT